MDAGLSKRIDPLLTEDAALKGAAAVLNNLGLEDYGQGNIRFAGGDDTMYLKYVESRQTWEVHVDKASACWCGGDDE